ncbi:hypothetical protein SMICM304S_05307 [Streptomyces microflavus]
MVGQQVRLAQGAGSRPGSYALLVVHESPRPKEPSAEPVIIPHQRPIQIAIGVLYLVTSCFTLAKVIRDRQEAGQIVSRVDQARLEKILAEHDPFQKL